MEIRLVRAGVEDAERIWKMQLEAFAELLEKYQDYETSPGAEPLERVRWRLEMESTYFYLIQTEGKDAGAIRVVDGKDGSTKKRISPIFVLPQYSNMGIAQQAIREAEKRHGSTGWSLETILQEEKNCHLYEKMGYRPAGKMETVNDKLTLVGYEKE